jgi:hypothetical protein
MSDQKLSDLTAESTIAPDDLVMAVDVSDTTMAATGTNKKVTRESLQTYNAGTLTTGKTVLDLSATWDRAQISVTGASGTGTIATLTFADQTTAPYAIGATIVVASVNPSGYNGTFVVTGCTATSVSYASTVTTTYVSGGNINLLFTGMKFNATNTASSTSSRLLDLQANGVSQFRVTRGGSATASSINIRNIRETTGVVTLGEWFVGSDRPIFLVGYRDSANHTWVGFNGNFDSSSFSFGINSNGEPVIANGTPINFTSGLAPGGTTDLQILRDAANTLAQRRTTNAQTFRLYGTFTDGSNNRRLALTSTTGGAFTIAAQGLGTGLTGNTLAFATDGTTRLTLSDAGAATFTGVVTAPNLANGRSMGRFTPLDNQPPAANFATLDTRNSIAVLDFDAGTDEAAVFVGVIPQAATLTSGIKVRIFWMATSATSGDCVWGAQFEKFGTDYDSDSFDTATTVTTTASGTSGIAVVSEITCTTIDSLSAGDMFRIKIYRDADAGGDTMTGNAELVAVELQQVA